MKNPMAYPPKNLKLAAMQAYLHVGFSIISLAELTNFVPDDTYSYSSIGTTAAFFLSNFPLFGSIIKSNPATPVPIPINPIKS